MGIERMHVGGHKFTFVFYYAHTGTVYTLYLTFTPLCNLLTLKVENRTDHIFDHEVFIKINYLQYSGGKSWFQNSLLR